MTEETERNLKTFENKICEHFIDETINWQRKYNRELYDMMELQTIRGCIVKIQQIQRLTNNKMERKENI